MIRGFTHQGLEASTPGFEYERTVRERESLVPCVRTFRQARGRLGPQNTERNQDTVSQQLAVTLEGVTG